METPLETRTLTDSEAWAIANALRLAAEEYKKESDMPRKLDDGNPLPAAMQERLTRQFKDQAKIALDLAETFEGAKTITVES